LNIYTRGRSLKFFGKIFFLLMAVNPDTDYEEISFFFDKYPGNLFIVDKYVVGPLDFRLIFAASADSFRNSDRGRNRHHIGFDLRIEQQYRAQYTFVSAVEPFIAPPSSARGLVFRKNHKAVVLFAASGVFAGYIVCARRAFINYYLFADSVCVEIFLY